MIVGDIEDEYDEMSFKYKKVSDDTYIIDGSMPIDKFNQLFNAHIYSGDSDTMAGIIIEQLGRFPQDTINESIQVDDYLFTTTDVDDGRIRKIKVHYQPREEDDE